jgi:hypothetical protein
MPQEVDDIVDDDSP